MIEITTEASAAVKSIMQERSLDSSLRIFLNSGG